MVKLDIGEVSRRSSTRRKLVEMEVEIQQQH
jgi:hypothetical protein